MCGDIVAGRRAYPDRLAEQRDREDGAPVLVRRCAGEDDFAVSIDLYNRVWPHRAVSAEEAANWRRTSLASAEYVAAVDGVDAGSAVAAILTQHPHVCLTLITVLPELRRRGAGGALYEAVSVWAREHDVDILETNADTDDDASLAFAARRGFTEHSREAGLELDVRGFAGDAPALPGVEIVSLRDRPELAEATWDVAVESIPDVPGGEDWRPPPRERWAREFLLSPASPPESLFVAVADGEVVGYAKLRLAPDRRSATHGMTAVKRAARGRGIATALKHAQIAWAKENGVERLRATNEERNVAMRRVNERLGYRPATGRVVLRGPLAGGAARRRSGRRSGPRSPR